MNWMRLTIVASISIYISACDHKTKRRAGNNDPTPAFVSQGPEKLQYAELPSDFHNGGPRGAACMGWIEYQSDELTNVWLSPDKSTLALPSSTNIGKGDQQCDFAIVGALQLSVANGKGERNLRLADIRIVPASNNKPFCQNISRREILKNVLPGVWSKPGDFDASKVEQFDAESIIFKKIGQTRGLGNSFRKVWPSDNTSRDAEQKRKYCR